MPRCPGCDTEMLAAYKPGAVAYYVCHRCGVSKIDVEPPTPMPEPPLRQTGLVCIQCNQPYAVIDNDGAGRFDVRCQRCGHRWTVPTSARKEPAPEKT